MRALEHSGESRHSIHSTGWSTIALTSELSRGVLLSLSPGSTQSLAQQPVLFHGTLDILFLNFQNKINGNKVSGF